MMFTKAAKTGVLVLLLICAVLAGVVARESSSDVPVGTITRHPEPGTFMGAKLRRLTSDTGRIDLRHADASDVDLESRVDVLLSQVEFSTRTIWPAVLPKAFDPNELLTHNMQPGLDIKRLHDQGITGKGVSIALIDETIFLDHQEYSGRVKHYEEFGPLPSTGGMHGSAIVSIAAGQTTGVAPDANLYLFAAGHVMKGEPYHDNYAKAIERVIEINRSLPEEERIRVIVISNGWMKGERGYEKVGKAVEKARQEGILLLNSNVSEYYEFQFHGLGRHPLSDPDDFGSYTLGAFWRERFLSEPQSHPNRALVPMDAMTIAAEFGVDDYAFYAVGGWSWSLPYMAGVYALALQVTPDLAPEEFLRLLTETGREMKVTVDGAEYIPGRIIDPVKLVATLREGLNQGKE